jgi:SAM-dependent methyltransferase
MSDPKLKPAVADYFARDDAATQWWSIDTDTPGVYAKQLDFLREHVERDGATALDVATGPGRFAIELARGGADVTAVDISSAMVERARANATREGVQDRVRFQVGDAAELSFPEASFDVVSIMEVLVHLPDPGGVLRSVARLVKPGGALVTNYHTPAAPRLTYPIDRARWRWLRLTRRLPQRVVMPDTVEETLTLLDQGPRDDLLVMRPKEAYQGIPKRAVDGWLAEAGLEAVAEMSERLKVLRVPLPVTIGKTVVARRR